MSDDKPEKFVVMDLTELQDEGVLLAANEAFFWPLGIALTWNKQQDGSATDLHIRQWEWPDGHREAIELKLDSAVGIERRRRFTTWFFRRTALMPIDEARAAAKRMKTLKALE